jgi:hypothetical protein
MRDAIARGLVSLGDLIAKTPSEQAQVCEKGSRADRQKIARGELCNGLFCVDTISKMLNALFVARHRVQYEANNDGQGAIDIAATEIGFMLEHNSDESGFIFGNHAGSGFREALLPSLHDEREYVDWLLFERDGGPYYCCEACTGTYVPDKHNYCMGATLCELALPPLNTASS